MKRTLFVLACLGASFLAACTSDSSLPSPTGKGAVRAINAIPGSPEIAFLIEERAIAGVNYKNSTAPAQYDDFSYNFNFEATLADGSYTRIATETLKVETGLEHVFLISGDLAAPTITVWNFDTRSFETAETVFEMRFSHASEALGQVDIYFDPVGTVPGTNPPAATLNFGEIGAPIDHAEGEYVMTVTAAGDLNTVHYQSGDSNLLARFAHLVTIYDGDAGDTAPIVARTMTTVGNPLGLPDAAYPPQIRFIHSASTLQSVDVYDDELLTNQIAASLDFKATTLDLDTSVELKTYYFTPAGSTATTLFSQELTSPAPGTFTHVYLVGDTDAWIGIRLVPDRSSKITASKMRVFHSAFDNTVVDAYVLERGVPLADDSFPSLVNFGYTFQSPTLEFAPGSYDLYITVANEKTVLAGPYEFDAALGDVFDLMIVDTVDPLVPEIIEIPIP